MTIGSKPLAAMIVTILFGGILLANGLGWWNTENTKTAARFTSGEFAGQANPADIRGSYTFGDVEKNFEISASLLAKAFQVNTADPQSFPVKSLESLYTAAAEQGFEIGTASVRLFVAFYKGLPFILTTNIYLPESAAQILQDRPLTEEQAAYLAQHTVTGAFPADLDGLPDDETSTPSASQETPVSTPQPENHEALNQYMVKGKTTFNELLEWGVSPEVIEKILGRPMPAAKGMLVREFCSTNGLSFETVKTALQAEVDLATK